MIKFLKDLFILLIFLPGLIYSSDSSNTFVRINENILEHGIGQVIDENWKYSSGDNLDWAKSDFDDSEWELVSSRLKEKYPESGFSGIGWFRIHLEVDSILINHPLGFSMLQAGASEIYLNGNLIDSFGKVGTSIDNEKLLTDRTPRPIKFRKTPHHVIAIRYSNHKTEFFNESGFDAGFSFTIDDLFDLFSERMSDVRLTTISQFSLIAIALVLGFFHLILYLYDKRAKENLYYVGFLISYGLFVFIKFQADFFFNQTVYVILSRFQIVCVVFTIITGAATVFAILKDFPKRFYLLVMLAVFVGILSLSTNLISVEWSLYSYVFITLLITSFRLYHTRFNDVAGIIIIRVGYAIMVLGLVYRIFQLLDFADPIMKGGDSYVYGILGFIVSMSILIAKNYSATYKNLEKQLVQVQELSEKTLAQELAAKEQEVKRQILEADNLRKTEELEEARELQLSMLPKSIPAFKNFDIAVFMKTATEVGGDYYDFNLVEDDHLTVTIGDATGHGTKAGIMVSTIKGLFSAFVDDLTIVEFFKKCTATIKRMELDKMLMSLTIIRVWQDKFTFCAAGMPPIYLYKKETNEVEEIIMEGMPLGAMKNFPYKIDERSLQTGDVILLMSDGFPEQQNDNNQMYDYPKTKELFESNIDKSAKEIIDVFVGEADIWKGNRVQDDDSTFIVIRVN